MCLFTNRSGYSACIMVLPLYPFVPPFLRKVTICSRHIRNGFSARHKDRRGTSHTMPCLPCYEMSLTLLKLRRYGFQVSRYGASMSRVYSLYFLSWLDGLQRCFSWCSLFILLCSGQNITEYKASWLMGVSIINPWGMRQPFFLLKPYARIDQPKPLCFQKSKQTSIRIFLNFTVNRDHINKKLKNKGGSRHAPAGTVF